MGFQIVMRAAIIGALAVLDGDLSIFRAALRRLLRLARLGGRLAWLACIVAACRGKRAPDPPATLARIPPRSAPTTEPAPATSTATSAAFYADHFSKKPSVVELTELGRRLFFDPELSASGKMACSTCHDPHFAYGPPNDRATQLGGTDLKLSGLRAVPSLRYLQIVPRFSEHYFDESVNESIDQGPTGGHAWDGRADTLHDQARLPLLSTLEMANASMDAVVDKVAHAAYEPQFQDAFGADVFSDPTRGSSAILLSLEVFQQSPKDFYPYSSRYDAWLRNQTKLSAAELRGLSLFNDPHKGNCAACHPSAIRHGAFPQFTDFGFAALGVPRNRSLPANRAPDFFDLGLCGPLRTDLTTHREYCGLFRAPTLRNSALRRTFFHNGIFHSLERAVQFYAERDTDPGKWYRGASGQVEAFDDLPFDVRQNVNHDPPFGKKRGAPPALNDAEVADLVGFLRTLTDRDLSESAAR